jgi:hypothetical protein
MRKHFTGIIAIAIIIVLGWLLASSASESKSGPYLEAAEMGGEYLIKHTGDNGRFNYEYDPIVSTLSTDYNILRHAGTTYSMLELFEVTSDKALLDASERALDFLAEQAVPCPFIEGALCIEENDDIKLGGNGLAILAFAKYQDATGSDKYLPLAQDLALFVSETQDEAGQFTAHKIDEGEITEFISGYYPGEAIFGLARLYEIDNDPRWMGTAHSGAQWLIEVRDKGLPIEKLNHDHWLLYGLYELYKDRPEDIYLDHARKITDAIVSSQHRDLTGAQELWNGGYYDPPRSTPTATRTEGLIAAYKLFLEAGDEEYARKALETAELGAEFQIRTQMTPAKTSFLKISTDAIGGFHESLTDYTIRIDYVQHNISALLGLDKITAQSR